MQRALSFALLIPCLLLAPSRATAQEDIATITFESIPEGTTIENGDQPISLEADTEVRGSLIATGEIESETGFRLPDGSLLASAATSAAVGLTANAGLYSNTVVDTTPANPFTEICLKSGEVLFDIHAAGESTMGGNCLPGDTGWIIERFKRSAGGNATWTDARIACLRDDMRLPEPFEWQFTCHNRDLLAVSGMTDNFEWASNESLVILPPSTPPLVASSIMGKGTCVIASTGIVARSNGQRGSIPWRCTR